MKTRNSTIRVELEGTYTRAQTIRVAGQGAVMESVSLDSPALVRELLRIFRKKEQPQV